MKTIEELAREAGLSQWSYGIRDDDTTSDYWDCWPEQLVHFASLIRAQALEEAAKVCSEIYLNRSAPNPWIAGTVAGRIRALKDAK